MQKNTCYFRIFVQKLHYVQTEVVAFYETNTFDSDSSLSDKAISAIVYFPIHTKMTEDVHGTSLKLDH